MRCLRIIKKYKMTKYDLAQCDVVVVNGKSGVVLFSAQLFQLYYSLFILFQFLLVQLLLTVSYISYICNYILRQNKS